MQPAKEEVSESGSNTMSRSEPNPYWLAVGHETTNEPASVGTCIGDGILLHVPTSVNGRQLTALIDSCASRCYMSPTLQHSVI